MNNRSLRTNSVVDWSRLGSLRLVARFLSDGIYAGSHHSLSRGAGVEFGGHRDYVQGDDLRFLDRRALMRHSKLLIREFETDSDRSLHLIVDASASMSFKSVGAPVSKYFFAASLAAALARLAIATGDPVGLNPMGRPVRSLPALGGREAFERILGCLEGIVPEPRTNEQLGADQIERVLGAIERQTRRGSIIVLLSDLVDLPDATIELFAGLGARRRSLVVVQVLDPLEQAFSFDGAVRLRAVEGQFELETDASAARAGYLGALEALRSGWRLALAKHGGELITCSTADDPVEVLRAIVQAPRRRSR